MNEPKSWLSFKLNLAGSALADSPVPVEVRKANLALVARTTAQQPVEVAPGAYWVTATLPAGQQLTTQVTVTPGEPAEAILEPEPDATPAGRPDSRAFYLKGIGGPSAGPGFESAEFKGISFEVGPKSTFKLRAANGNFLDGRPAAWCTNCEPEVTQQSGFLQVRWRAGCQVRLVQLLQPGQPPRNVMAPANPGQPVSCSVSRGRDGSPQVSIDLQNVQAEMLLQYYARGLLDAASYLTTGDAPALAAEKLLYDDRRDTIAATVSAYVLLRLNALERLHDWTQALCDWYAWLPDGLVIRAEHLGRTGRHAEALALLLKLPERGLPFFGDGVSYAVERLRYYWNAGQNPKAKPLPDLDRAQDLLQRLQSFASAASFCQPILSFSGLEPSAPATRPAPGSLDLPGALDISDYA